MSELLNNLLIAAPVLGALFAGGVAVCGAGCVIGMIMYKAVEL